MPSFIFNIPLKVWNSQRNNPKKYPINNIQKSFVDLSFNHFTFKDLSMNDISNNDFMQVTISWSSFIDKHTNDGLCFNSYIVPYYNDPSLNIIQFGNIPLCRNSAKNLNFWQFYGFAGRITATDSPFILYNTSLYNAFSQSTSSAYNNLSSWDISGVTDVRNIFFGALKFTERIGQWNYSNIENKQIQHLILNSGLNPVKTSIFLQDISSNPTFPNDSHIGEIPFYMGNPKTLDAIIGLNARNIEFNGIQVNPDVKVFKRLGYSTLDLRIAGYSPLDLYETGYTLLEYKSGKYTISELDTVNRYSLQDYKIVGYELSEFISSGYNSISLSSLNYTAGDYKAAGYFGMDLSMSFSMVDLINAGYPLSTLNDLGYTINQIKLYNNIYGILDYKKAGYTFAEISSAGYRLSEFQNYSVEVLRENNVFVSDFKDAGYDVNYIFNLGYLLGEFREAGYSIVEIQPYRQFTDLIYSSVGYSLTDISNAGYPISNLANYSPLPDVLKGNNIYAYEFKEIGYDITSIHHTFGYRASDLKDASYTLLEMKNVGISATEFKSIGYSASDLSSVGFTALELRNATYTLPQIQSAGYGIPDLKTAGYLVQDISNSYTILQIYNGGYSVAELVDANYEPYNLYNSLVTPNGPFSPFELMPILLENYPPTVMKITNLTLSAIYGIFGSDLDIIREAEFTPWDIKSINYNENLYLGTPIGSPNPIVTTNNISVLDLSNAGFTTSELLTKTMYLNSDITNALAGYRKYIPYPVFKPSELIYNNHDTNVQYKYSTIMPFEYAEPSFNTIDSSYVSLTNRTTNYIGQIQILDNSFGFYDLSKNRLQNYNRVNVSTNGWLSLSSNNTTVNVVRFFPYVTTSSIKYTFWTNSENVKILEIQMNGDVSGNPFLITTHIHQDGLMTFCNGYYNTNLFVPGNLLYSNPDPSMVTLTPNSMYYCLPMSNYYDISTNSIMSTMYDIFRIDLRSDIVKCGYLEQELINSYSLSNLNDAGIIGTVNNLRNIGYRSTVIKENNFPVFDIISVYNINIGIFDIMFYEDL